MAGRIKLNRKTMLFRVILPLIFIGLWSSAFLAAKVGVQYSTPLPCCCCASFISLVFAAMLPFARTRRKQPPPPPTRGVTWLHLSGSLLHSTYLGGVFFAFRWDFRLASRR